MLRLLSPPPYPIRVYIFVPKRQTRLDLEVLFSRVVFGSITSFEIHIGFIMYGPLLPQPF